MTPCHHNKNLTVKKTVKYKIKEVATPVLLKTDKKWLLVYLRYFLFLFLLDYSPVNRSKFNCNSFASNGDH